MEGFTYYYVESGNLLEEAMRTIDLCIPKTASELFFEADDNSIANNQQAQKSQNILIKAIRALKNMISTLIKKITDFIQRMFMSKEEKERFERFKQLAASDPNLKNKKMTLKDFRKINAEYQKAINDIDAQIAAIDRQSDEEAARTVEKVQEIASNVVKGIKQSATTIFSVDMALRLAENNKDAAKWIQKKLKNEDDIISNLEKQIGKERTADFQKKIKSSTRKISLHRIKVWMLGQYHGTMSGALSQTVNDFQDLLNPNTSLSSNIKRAKQMRIVDDAIGSFNTKTGANETKRSLLKRGKAVRKEVNTVKQGVKDFFRDGEKRLNKAEKKAKKSVDKTKKKAKNMKDFILS